MRLVKFQSPSGKIMIDADKVFAAREATVTDAKTELFIDVSPGAKMSRVVVTESIEEVYVILQMSERFQLDNEGVARPIPWSGCSNCAGLVPCE